MAGRIVKRQERFEFTDGFLKVHGGRLAECPKCKNRVWYGAKAAEAKPYPKCGDCKVGMMDVTPGGFKAPRKRGRPATKPRRVVIVRRRKAR